jgi:hypothetical protein
MLTLLHRLTTDPGISLLPSELINNYRKNFQTDTTRNRRRRWQGKILFWLSRNVMNLCTGSIAVDCSEHSRQFGNIALAPVRTGRVQSSLQTIACFYSVVGSVDGRWDVTSWCSVVGMYQRFGQRYCLHLEMNIAVIYFYLNYDNKCPCA